MRVGRAPRTAAALLGLLVVGGSMAGSVSGCAPAGGPPVSDGPGHGLFAEFAGDPVRSGPIDIEVPEHGPMHLDAAEFLPKEEISGQAFTTTRNEGVPMVVAVVRSWTPGGGRELPGHATTVLGIEVMSGEPILRSKVRAYLGKPHTSEIAGRSDLGVVAVAVEGAIEDADPQVIRRTVGIDAARGTHVWGLDGGYPGFGENTAQLFHASSRDACAERVERYHVGSGRVLAVDEMTAESAPELTPQSSTGAHCQRADEQLLLLK